MHRDLNSIPLKISRDKEIWLPYESVHPCCLLSNIIHIQLLKKGNEYDLKKITAAPKDNNDKGGCAKFCLKQTFSMRIFERGLIQTIGLNLQDIKSLRLVE